MLMMDGWWKDKTEGDANRERERQEVQSDAVRWDPHRDILRKE